VHKRKFFSTKYTCRYSYAKFGTFLCATHYIHRTDSTDFMTGPLLLVCLSVGLSVRENISGTTCMIFSKFFAHVPCVRGSVLLWHIYYRPHCLSQARVFFPFDRDVVSFSRRSFQTSRSRENVGRFRSRLGLKIKCLSLVSVSYHSVSFTSQYTQLFASLQKCM